MLSVSTPAASRALTTLDAVKARLAITDNTEDAYLTGAIDSVTAAIVAFLNVAPAEDGSRTIGSEALVETFRTDQHRPVRKLFLSRYPATAIATVTVDGVEIAPSDYELSFGTLTRLQGGCYGRWCGCQIVVGYTAGWLLPGQTGRNLPQDIEDAAIDILKSMRSARTRDPLLRSESFLESMYNYSLFSQNELDGGMPPETVAKLSTYRMVRL